MTINYTDLLQLAKPVQGTESGGWGDILNDKVTEMVEEAVAGLTVHNMTDGNSYTLTTANGATSQARNMMVEITDSSTHLSGGVNIVVPGTSKMYIFKNGTAQTLTVKTASNAGIAVPAGKTMLLHCDGANVEEGINQVVGNLAVGGTLGATGAVTMAAAATVGTTLGVTGNVTVNTDKLVVTASSGDTTSAGTVKGVNFTGSPTATVLSATADKDATAMTALIGQRIISTATGNTQYTLPDALSAGVAAGSTWVIVNAHASADITIVSGGTDDVIALCSGTAYTPGDASTNRTISQGGVAEIVCVAANLYVIFGGGVA